MRIRLDLAYDGTAFAGWARQPGLRTVQETLEDALSSVLRARARVVVAGRTDAGVHARGQVAHLDVDDATWRALPGRLPSSPADALVRRVNGLLDDDVVLHRAANVSDAFDARFAALSRTYCYRIADDVAAHDPLRRHDVLWVTAPLDVAAMMASAAPLVGLRDFAAFCKPRPEATTIRTLQRYDWERSSDGLVLATVTADAFCHSMVRSLVGTALAVGQGKRDVGWPAAALAAGQRLATVAPAHGLTLESVDYPAETDLLARVAQTMARRIIPNDA